MSQANANPMYFRQIPLAESDGQWWVTPALGLAACLWGGLTMWFKRQSAKAQQLMQERDRTSEGYLEAQRTNAETIPALFEMIGKLNNRITSNENTIESQQEDLNALRESREELEEKYRAQQEEIKSIRAYRASVIIKFNEILKYYVSANEHNDRLWSAVTNMSKVLKDNNFDCSHIQIPEPLALPKFQPITEDAP